jgi:hypothetical protein
LPTNEIRVRIDALVTDFQKVTVEHEFEVR